MMKHIRLLLPLRSALSAALWLLALPGWAQSDSARAGTAQDYFNRAAQQYVRKDKGSAMRVLDNGLRAHPGDARLLALAQELLKEEQQQDQKQQQQQQNQQNQQEQQQEQQQAERAERDKGEGMDKRDAERLLDQLNRDEQDVQEKARAKRVPARKRNPDKDW